MAMPEPPPGPEQERSPAFAGDRPIVFEGFSTLNTDASRSGIENDQTFICDGFMPLGKNNLRTLWGVGPSIFNAGEAIPGPGPTPPGPPPVFPCFPSSPGGGGCLIDKLVNGTVVLGAWSIARRLRNAYTGAYFNALGPISGDPTDFPSTPQCSLDTTLTGEFQAYVNAHSGSATMNLWYDQSGQFSATNGTFGNVMGNQKAGNAGYPRLAGGGSFNAPIGGYPAASTGYGATYSSSNAPSIVTVNKANGIPIPIPVGGTQFWFVAVIRHQAAYGDPNGRLASLYATPFGFPIHDADTVVSAIVLGRDNNDAGPLYGFRDSAALSTLAIGSSPTIVASVFDGATQQTWVAGASGGGVASSGSFGATAAFGLGDVAAGPAATPLYPCAMDVVEALCGTSINPTDLATIFADMTAFYGL